MTLVLACTFSIPVSADDITADILTYDGNSKIATAEGNVVIHANQGAVITGQKGQYYFGDRSAWLEGNVRYEKDETVMTADKLYIYNDKTVHGTGSVYLNDRAEGRVLKGDDVTYNADTGIGKIRGGGYLEFSDASMQAPLIEGNLKQVEIVASGGVNLTSDSRQMTGYSDVATYTRSGINGNDGKLVLTGLYGMLIKLLKLQEEVLLSLRIHPPAANNEKNDLSEMLFHRLNATKGACQLRI